MSTQEARHEDLAPSDKKKGKRKARYCDLEGQEGVVCDYEKHGASIVSEKVIIPSSSQYLDLVGKALCRKHYNKLIVNAKKSKINNECSHPKHRFYVSTARHGMETKTIKKAPERLIKFFKLPQGAMMCRHCLYKTDTDPEYVNLPNYPPAPERIPKENIRIFQGRSYILRSDVIYSESEFQELEASYNGVCAELDEAKLGK
jgi:hypothetical protein